MAKTKSEKVILEGSQDRDKLVDSLAAALNKDSKDGKCAFFLGEHDDPSTVSDWISTGSSMLDIAISNRPHGGLPVGRIIEFQGLEGSGKSLLAAHVVANTQKKGGVAVLIDTENAAAPDFWQSLGVDLSKLLYIPCESVEQVFEQMEALIAIVRKSTKKRLLTIIVDSVAAVSTKAELESDHGKDGWATTKAIIIGKALRKITNMLGREQVLTVFTNQLRQNLGAGLFGDKWIVPGGKAMAFHCSVRVRLSKLAKLKRSELIIGNKCKAVVIKNRMGPPQRFAEFDIYFDSGIADYASWLTVLTAHKILKKGDGGFKYTTNSGKLVTFTVNEFVSLLTNDADLKEELYLKICDILVMKYKDPNSLIVEDATLDTESVDEDDVSDDKKKPVVDDD